MPEACPRGVGTSKKPRFLGRGGVCLPVMVSEESGETLFSTDSEWKVVVCVGSVWVVPAFADENFLALLILSLAHLAGP